MTRQDYEMVPAGSVEALQMSLKSMERRWQLTMAGWALTVVMLAVVGIVALNVVRQALQPATIQARAVHVIDAAGRTRIDLSVGFNGPNVTLYDAAGKARVGLVQAGDGSQIVLTDAYELERAGLHVSGNGLPDLILSDAAGSQAVLTPTTAILDKNKKVVWAAP